MLREKVDVIDGYEVIVLDSASQIRVEDKGRVVIAASNGGRESGRAAILAGCALVVFNDAGVGKERAGVIGLDLIDERGIPGMAVSHDSAEISDGLGTWNHGILSCVNEAAAALGVSEGMSVRDAVNRVCEVWKERS